MAAWISLTVALGVGLALAAHTPGAMAAGQSDGAPPVTGSMYNGNNTQPPAAFLQDHDQPGGYPAVQGGASDNPGGNSTTARAGGGG